MLVEAHKRSVRDGDLAGESGIGGDQVAVDAQRLAAAFARAGTRARTGVTPWPVTPRRRASATPSSISWLDVDALGRWVAEQERRAARAASGPRRCWQPRPPSRPGRTPAGRRGPRRRAAACRCASRATGMPSVSSSSIGGRHVEQRLDAGGDDERGCAGELAEVGGDVGRRREAAVDAAEPTGAEKADAERAARPRACRRPSSRRPRPGRQHAARSRGPSLRDSGVKRRELLFGQPDADRAVEDADRRRHGTCVAHAPLALEPDRDAVGRREPVRDERRLECDDRTPFGDRRGDLLRDMRSAPARSERDVAVASTAPVRPVALRHGATTTRRQRPARLARRARLQQLRLAGSTATPRGRWSTPRSTPASRSSTPLTSTATRAAASGCSARSSRVVATRSCWRRSSARRWVTARRLARLGRRTSAARSRRSLERLAHGSRRPLLPCTSPIRARRSRRRSARSTSSSRRQGAGDRLLELLGRPARRGRPRRAGERDGAVRRDPEPLQPARARTTTGPCFRSAASSASRTSRTSRWRAGCSPARSGAASEGRRGRVSPGGHSRTRRSTVSRRSSGSRRSVGGRCSSSPISALASTPRHRVRHRGRDKPEQVRANAAAGSWELTPGELSELAASVTVGQPEHDRTTRAPAVASGSRPDFLGGRMGETGGGVGDGALQAPLDQAAGARDRRLEPGLPADIRAGPGRLEHDLRRVVDDGSPLTSSDANRREGSRAVIRSLVVTLLERQARSSPTSSACLDIYTPLSNDAHCGPGACLGEKWEDPLRRGGGVGCHVDLDHVVQLQRACGSDRRQLARRAAWAEIL